MTKSVRYLLIFSSIILLLGSGCGDNGGFWNLSNGSGDSNGGKDRDKDCIPDSLEDKDGDGFRDKSETDPLEFDSDNDGLGDGIEDSNCNGERDPGETDPRVMDSDYDGLIDSEEDKNSNGKRDPGETDPLARDSDLDGLDDKKEIDAGLDPNNPDSDNDGLKDGEEDINLNGQVDPGETDPKNPDSDGDGVSDSQESSTMACSLDKIKMVKYQTSVGGEYKLALEKDFQEKQLSFTNVNSYQKPVSTAFDQLQYHISGFILSRTSDKGVLDVEKMVENDKILLQKVCNIKDRMSRLYTTHDKFKGDITHYSINFSSQIATGKLRDKLLAALTGKAEQDILDLPEGDKMMGNNFEIYLNTVFRDKDNVLTVMAISQKSNYDQSNEVQMMISDLTNGTALAKAGNNVELKCDQFVAKQGAAQADFLWVVDKSGSMKDDRQTVINTADLFFKTLQNSYIDYRVAITSTDYNNRGKLGALGFTNDVNNFKKDMETVPGGNSEFGLESGINAISLASDANTASNLRFRGQAKKIIIFFSDEEDQSVENWEKNVVAKRALSEFVTYYSRIGVTCFAIVGDPSSPSFPTGGCKPQSSNIPGSSSEAGDGYIAVANATGGSWGSICSPNLQNTIDQMMVAATGIASDFKLTATPISPTLKLVKERVEVPRNYQNGFDYDSVSNSLIFFGTFRPSQGEEFAVSYRSWGEGIGTVIDPGF